MACPPAQRGCGYEFNTSFLYHHRDARAVHAHVAPRHEHPHPWMRCADRPPHAPFGRVAYGRHEMLAFRRYVTTSGRPTNTTLCVLLEPRYLRRPRLDALIHSGFL